MNLYLISQTKNTGYDTFDSAVVAAESEGDAKEIHPAGGSIYTNRCLMYGWVKSPDDVSVELIGIANKGIESGVICGSFNAG